MIRRTMTWTSRAKRASIFISLCALLTVSMSYVGTLWANIILVVFAVLFVFVMAAVFLKFVSQVLYRLSGGYEREILDELRDHREQQE